MPGHARSARRKDALILSGCTVILLIVTIPVVSMIHSAWTLNALSFNLVHTFMNIIGADIDIAVVLSAGICLGWFGLFLFDRSKRIQAVVLTITGLGFVFLLVGFGRWVTVDWFKHIEFLLSGAVIGILVGASGAFSKRSVREFPVAAAGLYSVATVVAIVSFFEAHLDYKSPLVAFPNANSRPVTSSLVVTEGLLIDGISVVLFITVLATFVQYNDQKEVVLIAPDARSETELLAGLFDSIRNRREGHSIDRDAAVALSNVVGTIRSGHQPDSIDGEDIVLRFKRPGALSRWVEITPQESRAKHLGTPPFARLRKREQGGPFGILRRGARKAVTTAVPFELSKFAPNHRRLIERIHRADVVVLVAQTTDALESETGYIDAYREIDDIYADDRSKRVVIAALEAQSAFDDFQTDRGIEPKLSKSSFEDYLRRSIFRVRCQVVPLSTESDEETISGSDELLALIER